MLLAVGVGAPVGGGAAAVVGAVSVGLGAADRADWLGWASRSSGGVPQPDMSGAARNATSPTTVVAGVLDQPRRAGDPGRDRLVGGAGAAGWGEPDGTDDPQIDVSERSWVEPIVGGSAGVVKPLLGLVSTATLRVSGFDYDRGQLPPAHRTAGEPRHRLWLGADPVPGLVERRDGLIEADRRDQQVVGVVGGEGNHGDAGPGQRVDEGGQAGGEREVRGADHA